MSHGNPKVGRDPLVQTCIDKMLDKLSDLDELDQLTRNLFPYVQERWDRIVEQKLDGKQEVIDNYYEVTYNPAQAAAIRFVLTQALEDIYGVVRAELRRL